MAGWHAVVADTTWNGSLCCGFSGQAYALLALYRQSNDKAWLHRAESLAERAAIACRDLLRGSDSYALAPSPDSLYNGELGVAVLAADLDAPHTSAQPAFEFIEF
jgi:serine/threonine-protein kinase